MSNGWIDRRYRVNRLFGSLSALSVASFRAAFEAPFRALYPLSIQRADSAALKTMRQVTAAEVSAHNSPADAWITIDGKVYDVTKFAAEHPGGKKILLGVAGKDASKQFTQFHSPAVASQWLPKLLVGTLVSTIPTKTDKVTSNQWMTGENEVFGDLAPFCEPAWWQDNYSPYYNESHRRLRSFMRDWISTHILPNAEEWESSALKSTSYLPKSLHRAAGAAGILRVVAGPSAWGPENTISSIPGIPALPAGIPEGEFDFFHEMIVWDGLVSCGYPGVINGFTIGAAFAAPPLIKYASEEVKKRVLPLVMSGEEQIALCITEPHAGSDVQGITTTARISDDGAHFIVNGEKKWITNGTYATFFTTAVRTGGDRGGGISILLVERGPGLSTRHVFTQASVLGGTAYVTFEDLRVPASNIVGKLNGGFHALLVNFNRERMTIATQCARHSRLVYADALHYAHRRKTFGKVLIEHPVIRDKFAQMARQIESLQCWIEFVYYQMHKMPSRIVDERLGGTCALLKLQGTRTFEFCAREAAQVMGGIAYTRGGQGGRVERLYREVRGAAIPGGSEEIMADVGMRQSLKAAGLMGASI